MAYHQIIATTIKDELARTKDAFPPLYDHEANDVASAVLEALHSAGWRIKAKVDLDEKGIR